MSVKLEVLLTPADYQTREARDWAGCAGMVFDVLRATSVMVTGLANGAAGFVPAGEIGAALELRRKHPRALLAGERGGLRITAAQSGGVDFDLGNSPTEYTSARVAGRTIISTTTNGTCALQACHGAAAVAIGSFLNLTAAARWLSRQPVGKFVLVCAGTGSGTALEDVLAAGAMCDWLLREIRNCELDDAAKIATQTWHGSRTDLAAIVSGTQNGRHLLRHPVLRGDVEICLQRDVYDLVGVQDQEGIIRPVRDATEFVAGR